MSTVELPTKPAHRTQQSSKSLPETNYEGFHPIMPQSSLEISQVLAKGIKVVNKDTSGVIGPLGLMGFGLTTFLLNLHNAGAFGMSPVILAMGMAYGGAAQIFAGVFEWIKGNNFTGVAFLSYGTFWWSLVLIHAIPVWGWTEAVDHQSMAFYLFIWFVFSVIMTIAAFTKPWIIRIIFTLLSILFLLLAIHHWAESTKVGHAAGVIGIICALCAMYAGAAEIINEAWGVTILPLGAPGEKCFGKIEE